MTLTLPERTDSADLLPFLSLLDTAKTAPKIIIDFANLSWVSPASLVALAARVQLWLGCGQEVRFRNVSNCPIAGYLARMDLFRACNLPTDESLPAYDGTALFVPVRKIDVDVEKMGSEMALCVAPGGDDGDHAWAGVYDLVWYVLTEVANNVRQHSGGTGFATAQVRPGKGLVQLAIADNGKGVRQSFVQAGFKWAAGLDDISAIRKAMEPFVSSKGNPTNEGVGLTLTAELARQARAWLMIASGKGAVILNPDAKIETEDLPAHREYPGTLVAMTFPQESVPNFAKMLHDAKTEVGLLQPKASKGRFG